MNNVLEYACGCKYFVSANRIQPMNLCKDHKIQAEKATLEAIIGLVENH